MFRRMCGCIYEFVLCICLHVYPFAHDMSVLCLFGCNCLLFANLVPTLRAGSTATTKSKVSESEVLVAPSIIQVLDWRRGW